ncbi:MAG TPA: cache domain-containing protein, partial [Candidatus Krumholzibacteria bacterium]|nr:cache domain-containing protein [Candidatus Krumholzibacteria bacterium]
MARFTLKTKLLTAFLAAGILPFAIFALIALRQASSSLEDQTFAQLVSLRDIKKEQVERYLETISNQAMTFSEEFTTVEAMAAFAEDAQDVAPAIGRDVEDLRAELAGYYRQEFGGTYREQNGGKAPDVERVLAELDDVTVAMQWSYIQANPRPLGSKHQLDRAPEASGYNEHHALYHPALRHFLETFGYYDIFLVDQQSGRIVYSTFKELDYATSLKDGPYADSGLGDVYRRAAAAQDPDAVVFADFRTYFPSYEAPAAFVASPIVHDGERIGVLAMQFPLDNLNAMMGARSGLGETGETYLVGADKLMRSDSFLDPEHHSVVTSFRKPETGKVDTEASRAAL